MQANASYDQRQADRWEEALRAKLAYRYHFMPDENPLPEGVTWAGLHPLARLDIMHEICEFRAVECPYVRHGIDRTVSPPPPPARPPRAGALTLWTPRTLPAAQIKDWQKTGGSAALKLAPFGTDAYGNAFYYLSYSGEDCRLYREVPPERPYSNRNWRPHQDAEWHTECTTLEELEAFAEYYKASPDEGEQAMYAKLNEVVVPKLRETAAARKRAADRQRAYEAAPKKRSGRIATLQVVREQEEAMRKQRAEEERVWREQEAQRRKQREAERKALQREIALQRAKEEQEQLQREREEARERRYQQRLVEQQKLALEQQKLAFERQKRLIKRKATDDDWDWEWWWDGIEDGSIFWRGKKRRSLRKKEGLQGGYVKVFRGGRSAKNGEPLRVRKPPTDEQIAKQVGKVVEKLVDTTEELAARPAKRAKGTPRKGKAPAAAAAAAAAAGPPLGLRSPVPSASTAAQAPLAAALANNLVANNLVANAAEMFSPALAASMAQEMAARQVAQPPPFLVNNNAAAAAAPFPMALVNPALPTGGAAPNVQAMTQQAMMQQAGGYGLGVGMQPAGMQPAWMPMTAPFLQSALRPNVAAPLGGGAPAFVGAPPTGLPAVAAALPQAGGGGLGANGAGMGDPPAADG